MFPFFYANVKLGQVISHIYATCKQRIRNWGAHHCSLGSKMFPITAAGFQIRFFWIITLQMSLVGQSSSTTQIHLLQSYPQSTRPPPHAQAWKPDAMKLPAHSLYADVNAWRRLRTLCQPSVGHLNAPTHLSTLCHWLVAVVLSYHSTMLKRWLFIQTFF